MQRARSGSGTVQRQNRATWRLFGRTRRERTRLGCLHTTSRGGLWELWIVYPVQEAMTEKTGLGNKGHGGLSSRCLWRHMLMGNPLGRPMSAPSFWRLCMCVCVCTEWVSVIGACVSMNVWSTGVGAVILLQLLSTCLQKNFKTRSLIEPAAHQFCQLALGTLPHVLRFLCLNMGCGGLSSGPHSCRRALNQLSPERKCVQLLIKQPL